VSSHARALCFLVASLASAPARAQQSQPTAPADVSGAAAAFDEGVKSFQRADYGAAARAFLRADELVPSADALSNAIAAGRRANDHLLVVTASRRAIAREAEHPELAANAREALVQAERHVSRLELSCKSKAPCSLVLDGSAVPAGTTYVLAGLHVVVASTERGERSERKFETVPGSTYSMVLEPSAEGRKAPPAPPVVAAAPSPERAVGDKPLPKAVFWSGVGVSAALTGLTIWSGLDVVNQRDELPPRPSAEQASDDGARIRRTDVLLIGTVVVAALTTYTGLALVDWGSQPASAARPLGFSF